MKYLPSDWEATEKSLFKYQHLWITNHEHFILNKDADWMTEMNLLPERANQRDRDWRER